ncbi:MAG: hypothetical protein Ct9H300mP26_4880 [Acidimicrobiales bacterium]|nr:MAG: hypothetical protein Ct9H300mP26_4880 [Acidimicrobiales bacterium]
MRHRSQDYLGPIYWGAASYEEVLATHSPLLESEDCTHDDTLTIMYTSGTTGRPKGAIITQGMTFWNAVNSVEYYPAPSP